jgi:uncharacterized membrane protein
MDLMDLAHLHLLLNHFPTIGTVIGLGLLLLALVRKNDHLKHVSFEVFFLIALATMLAYLTGVAAQQALEGVPDASESMIVAHHDAALWGFLLMQLTGAAAWLGLWQFRRYSRPSTATLSAVLVLALITAATMARAANLGGEIRHPEIRVEQAAGATAATGWLSTVAIAQTISGEPWVWPAAETLHFIGLCMVLGVLLAVNLRLLGMMKEVPYAHFHRLLPWALLGFGLNLVTGMMFVIAAPGQYTENISFYWKIAFMMIACADLLYLTVFRKAWTLEPGDDPRLADKVIAASAIGAWVGVIYFGRMLPFLGNAF